MPKTVIQSAALSKTLLVLRLMHACVLACPQWPRSRLSVCMCACPPSSVESRSRFCCVCVWSWAGWVSRPSQMNRGWEEAWRGCRGWEARALPKKLLLWDLCTFAFLTKHKRLAQTTEQPGRQALALPEVGSIAPSLLFKLYSFFPFTISLFPLFSSFFPPSVPAAAFHHFPAFFFNKATYYVHTPTLVLRYISILKSCLIATHHQLLRHDNFSLYELLNFYLTFYFMKSLQHLYLHYIN